MKPCPTDQSSQEMQELKNVEPKSNSNPQGPAKPAQIQGSFSSNTKPGK